MGSLRPVMVTFPDYDTSHLAFTAVKLLSTIQHPAPSYNLHSLGLTAHYATTWSVCIAVSRRSSCRSAVYPVRCSDQLHSFYS